MVTREPVCSTHENEVVPFCSTEFRTLYGTIPKIRHTVLLNVIYYEAAQVFIFLNLNLNFIL